MKVTEGPVIVSERYRCQVRRLWDCIVKPELMRVWYFDNMLDFRAEVGFETEFVIEHNGRIFTHLWKVDEVREQKKISYLWSYREWPGQGRVIFEIEPAGQGSRLTLTNEVLEDFDDSIEEFRRDSCVSGWQYLLQRSLKKFIDGTDISDTA